VNAVHQMLFLAALPPDAGRQLALRGRARSPTQIEWKLSIPDGPSVIDGFGLRCKTGGGAWEAVYSVQKNPFLEEGLEPSTRRTCRARWDYDLWSPPAAVTTLAAPAGPPARPQRLIARAVSPFRIALSWRRPRDAEWVVVQQAKRDGAFVDLAYLYPWESRLGDGGLLPDTRRIYRLKAVNRHGESPPSRVVTAKTPPHRPHHRRASSACLSSRSLRLQECGARSAHRFQLGRGKSIEMLDCEDDSGSLLLGWLDGCRRDLGTIQTSGFGDPPEVIWNAGERWPVLRSALHEGEGSGSILTYDFDGTQWKEVDRIFSCGRNHLPDSGDDLWWARGCLYLDH